MSEKNYLLIKLASFGFLSGGILTFLLLVVITSRIFIAFPQVFINATIIAFRNFHYFSWLIK